MQEVLTLNQYRQFKRCERLKVLIQDDKPLFSKTLDISMDDYSPEIQIIDFNREYFLFLKARNEGQPAFKLLRRGPVVSISTLQSLDAGLIIVPASFCKVLPLALLLPANHENSQSLRTVVANFVDQKRKASVSLTDIEFYELVDDSNRRPTRTLSSDGKHVLFNSTISWR
eukprot:Gregarina_sp_Poly_1__599@NODE_1141_length_4960_cov_269_731453_g787_i0_p4_GENE_NODE_1141_length_4960_cov_269_731453_g787_i0NODE_1141_length_4960_cov_269_731453_g787_i0_p4_ORF_typecomplete_len171_score20_18_NODE_1141_length_4960_cov_269_731453_g787_i035014013